MLDAIKGEWQALTRAYWRGRRTLSSGPLAQIFKLGTSPFVGLEAVLVPEISVYQRAMVFLGTLAL